MLALPFGVLMSIPQKSIIASKTVRRVSTPGSQDISKDLDGLTLGFEEIQKLISLMGREPIDELQLEVGNVKLHVRKAVGNNAVPTVTQISTSVKPATTAQNLVTTDQQSPDKLNNLDVRYITSPIVGTFYRAPSINASAFVQPGDLVRLGQTLCIVEAMKLMNEIECDIAGELVDVMVEDGQPVEYGERLFSIRAC
jgi:acetyl-CoA carboxylase biotin carboxyl carrier protein